MSMQRILLILFVNIFCVKFVCSKDWDDLKVKAAIKKLLEYYSQTHLERMLCPFSQVTFFSSSKLSNFLCVSICCKFCCEIKIGSSVLSDLQYNL